MPETNLAITTDGPLRRFSDAKVGAAVDTVLATIPADKSGAVLAVADLHGARLAVAARIGSNWTIVGVLEKPTGIQAASSVAM